MKDHSARTKATAGALEGTRKELAQQHCGKSSGPRNGEFEPEIIDETETTEEPSIVIVGGVQPPPKRKTPRRSKNKP